MGFSITDILGGSVLEWGSKILDSLHLSAEKKADMQIALNNNANVLALKQMEYENKLQDAISSEVHEAAEIIKAEAQSQSWLPRNVRPLLLFMWGCMITFNPLAAVISRLLQHPIDPIVLDPWVYKLTAIGFTGYVTARTIEKVKGVAAGPPA